MSCSDKISNRACGRPVAVFALALRHDHWPKYRDRRWLVARECRHRASLPSPMASPRRRLLRISGAALSPIILSERPDARLCSGHAGIYRGPGRSISPTTCLFPGRTGCPAAASIFADDFIGSNRTCTLSAIRFTATAFSSAWSVNNASAEKVELARSNGAGPFSYEARATYALDAGALKNVAFWCVTVGNETLPCGPRLSPLAVRCPGALLQAKAKRVVLEDNDHLPDGEADCRFMR